MRIPINEIGKASHKELVSKYQVEKMGTKGEKHTWEMHKQVTYYFYDQIRKKIVLSAHKS